MIKTNKNTKSRIGTLLVKRNLISQEQLYEALSLQTNKQLKLGEILINKGWITQNDLSAALKRQSRYRMAATIGAMLLAPLQPFMATSSIAHKNEETHVYKITSLSEKPISQTTDKHYFQFTKRGIQTETPEKETIGNQIIAGDTDLGNIINTLLPGASNILDADIRIQGVEYNEQGNHKAMNEDGSINVRLPSKIRNISIKNIEFKGIQGTHIGDIEISNLSINPETTVRVNIKS